MVLLPSPSASPFYAEVTVCSSSCFFADLRMIIENQTSLLRPALERILAASNALFKEEMSTYCEINSFRSSFASLPLFSYSFIIAR